MAGTFGVTGHFDSERLNSLERRVTLCCLISFQRNAPDVFPLGSSFVQNGDGMASMSICKRFYQT